MFLRILFHPSIFPLVFLAVFLINTQLIGSVQIGLMLLILFLGVYGYELGGIVAKQERGPLRWWIGALVLVCCLMVVLTGAYYLFAVPKELVIVLILLTPPLVGILGKQTSSVSLFDRFHLNWREKTHRIPGSVFLSAALLLFFAILFLRELTTHPIMDSVRSPWERLDSSLFLLFFFVLLLLFGLLARGRERALTLPLTSLTLFLFLSVALLTFPIGYGFDSFIHRATESHLAEFGTITPKPFYYIGQYVLVLLLHHGFSLPVQVADAYLVPIMTALFLPIAWYSAALHITRKKQLSALALTGLFLIPLSTFIVTTPQALSNLLTLLLVLSSVPYLFHAERPRLWLCVVLALSALVVHPIAGLPAMLFVVMLFLDPSRAPKTLRTLSRSLFIGLVAVASVILPASFMVNAAMSGQTLLFDVQALSPLRLFKSIELNFLLEQKFHPLLDLVYLIGSNSLLLFFFIVLVGFFLYRTELSARTHILLWMAFALGMNYLVLSTALDFTFLITYERLNYADRLIPLLLFFLIPFFVLGLSHVFINLRSRPILLRISFLLFLLTWSLSAFYLAYPRRDFYDISRSFNTSAADLATVRLIESWADTKPYLVLANQSVSAAAISEIGFRYYGSLFFYPIPTGEMLYQEFLTMNETPTREIAERALAHVPMHEKVFTIFFVVNDYWWNAPRIVERAKLTANAWQGVGGVHIFRYDF